MAERGLLAGQFGSRICTLSYYIDYLSELTHLLSKNGKQ